LLLSKETRHSGLSEVEGQNPAISPLPVFAVILSGVRRTSAPNAVEGPLYLFLIVILTLSLRRGRIPAFVLFA